MARNRYKPRGKRSEEGQYINLPYAMLKSPAWRSLSGSALKVWCELHARFSGGNNGRIHLSMNEAAQVLGMGKATVQRAFVELEVKGFVVLEVPGDWYARRAHDWRLTTKPTQVSKGSKGSKAATNEWRDWRPHKTKRGSDTDPSAIRMVPP